MKSEIVEAFSEIAKERNIDKEVLAEIIESVFMGMIKKRFGTTDNFDIFVNFDKGEIEIYQNKKIVEEVTDETCEIDLETARKVEPDLEIGDDFVEIIDPASFGRRLILSARQNLTQRLKELEKESTYQEFSKRIGEIVSGDIRQVAAREGVYIVVERTEVLMPPSEQIPTEHYRRGETIKAVVKRVEQTPKGPQVIVSRADDQFLIRLFELEVPEISDGIIEIKAIAREPGERTKIAVYSNDKRIDAVGACVGMKGIRIQSIVKELNNEKIDIIPWSSEPEIFVSRALSPAKPSRIILDEDNKTVIAMLPDDQISLAIGRGGQNRRLASQLTGYDIQPVKESEYRDLIKVELLKDRPLTTLTELRPSVVRKLLSAGLQNVRDVLESDVQGLMNIRGIGQKTAEEIVAAVNKELNQ